MKKLLPFVLLLCCLPVGCSHKESPKGLSTAKRTALGESIDALDRAVEYMNRADLLYEPRFLDAEQKISALKAVEGSNFDDSAVDQRAYLCLAIIKHWRLDKRLFAQSPTKNEGATFLFNYFEQYESCRNVLSAYRSGDEEAITDTEAQLNAVLAKNKNESKPLTNFGDDHP